MNGRGIGKRIPVKIYNYGEPSGYDEKGRFRSPPPEIISSNAHIVLADMNNTSFLGDGVGQIGVSYLIHLRKAQAYPERQLSTGGTIRASVIHFEINGEQREVRVMKADNRPQHAFCRVVAELTEGGVNDI